MSLCLSFINIHKGIPTLSSSPPKLKKNPSLSVKLKNEHQQHNNSRKQANKSIVPNALKDSKIKILCLTAHIGGVLATVADPAISVTGVNDEEDLIWVLIQLGITAFFYFIVAPPLIMNWLRRRWYKRNLLEMFFQFMFVFMFYPGVLLWAPFLNFRKFPRDPSMKYPWDMPEDPSKIKGGALKYPWAKIEDYEV